MRRKIFLSLALSLFVFVATAYGERVRYVIDGDTFIIESQERIRMIGINAPEIDHAKYHKKGQYFGKESRDYLKNLIEHREVVLKSGDEPFDRFGRRLAYVYLGDGTFVNRKMVEEGYAETFRKFPFAYKKEFLELESRARAAKRGMWAQTKSKPLKWNFLKYLLQVLR